MAAAGVTISSQGVATIELMPRRQEEAGTAHVLCHQCLGVMAEVTDATTSLGIAGPHRMSLMPTIQQADDPEDVDIVSMTLRREKQNHTSAPTALV